MRYHRIIPALGIVVMLAVAFAACGDDDDGTGPPDDGTFNGTIRIVDNAFSPRNVTISVGDSVTWRWEGTQSHSVTHGSSPTVPPDASKLFDVGPQTNGTFGYRFNNAGAFPYFCRPHFAMGMTGSITVEP